MYKTEVDLQRTIRNLIMVEMNSEKDNIHVYIRDAVDCRIVNEAGIDLSPEGFIDLVCPILKARGYALSPPSEGF